MSFVVPAVVRRSTVMVAIGTLMACSQSDSSGRQPLGDAAGTAASPAAMADAPSEGPKLPLEALQALDAGNTAYRAKQFDRAIAKYREAAAAAPAHAAPWFGLYMAANEIKNAALADSAMAKVKALSADPAALNAHVEVASPSVIPKTPSMPQGHPSAAAPGEPPLPAGHPAPALPPGHPKPVKTDSTKRSRM